MTKQYFYMFSNGSYSDYCVGGMYVCDHEVTEKEWEEHFQHYLENVASTAPGWHNYDARNKWEEENRPEITFQKKHNMKPVEYEEFWRD